MASVTVLPSGDLVIMGGRGRNARGLDRVFKVAAPAAASDNSSTTLASPSTGDAVPVTSVPTSGAQDVTAVTQSYFQIVTDWVQIHPIWSLVILAAIVWVWEEKIF